MRTLFLVIACASLIRISSAQTLQPGDIAIIGLNGTDPNEFAFVNMVDLFEDEIIWFTDNGWKADGSFLLLETVTVFVAEADIPRGTVTVITEDSGAPALSTDGDQLFAYLTNAQGEVDFLHGVNNEGDGEWDVDATDSHTSALPDDLSPFFSSVALPQCANVAYIGINTGTQAELLVQIAQASNWICNNDFHLNLQLPEFTVTSTLPHAPYFTEKFDQVSILAEEEMEFQFQAMDRDPGTVIRYRSRLLPAGATLDEVSGLFRWTPTPDQEGSYTFAISASDGTVATEHEVTIMVATDSAIEAHELPGDLTLDGHYPNPARTHSTLAFTLGSAGRVRLEVVDALGRRMHEEDLGIRTSGRHQIRLDLGDFLPGAYLYRIRTDLEARSSILLVH